MVKQAQHLTGLLKRPAKKQTRRIVGGFFSPPCSDKTLDVAYLTAKRGSCGLSSKSIFLRSHQTTPLLTPNQRKDIQSKLWSLLSALILDFHSCFQTSQGNYSIWKRKEFPVLYITLCQCDSENNMLLLCWVIKYLLGLFGHCTSLIISRLVCQSLTTANRKRTWPTDAGWNEFILLFLERLH